MRVFEQELSLCLDSASTADELQENCIKLQQFKSLIILEISFDEKDFFTKTGQFTDSFYDNVTGDNP